MAGAQGQLKRGWTTGACATAAASAAFAALATGHFPDPVTITLPRGETPSFALHEARLGEGWAMAAIVKDAGDDPDVTHGAIIAARLTRAPRGSGIVFRAGAGVGTVTKPGLPLAVGEPAINPAPRRMMQAAIAALATRYQVPADVEIEIAVPGGEKLAERTWNPRLGIIGGISILGTTGIVVPYSCSAWIHSIRRGIDVARATGLRHIVGCTGNTSEMAARTLLGLGAEAMIDMGDFVGGMLKYLRRHPVERVGIAGGFAKLSKLAAGALDLHSRRSQVATARLAADLAALGAEPGLVEQAGRANTAMEILALAESRQLPLAGRIAAQARMVAQDVLGDAPVAVEVMVFDRSGRLAGRSP
ncbi:MAG TPA: cobalt-precorrin-5B (C(1))-methyltransferase [Stellaceae bacterium]|nr:cobalt-precorrin-5B (C(1))-methyltransferase [Stellaceae bacterium]